MYVTEPCNLPNSQSPISAKQIQLSQMGLAFGNGAIDWGNRVMDAMVKAMGGNPAGTATGGNAGVPTLGPYGGKPPALQWGGPGSAVARLPVPRSCNGVPEVVPLVTVLPVPYFVDPAPPPAPVSTPAPAPVAAPAPVPVAKDYSICNFTPLTICAAIRAGCFKAGQVDSRQLAECAASGWQGNENRFPELIAKGGWNNGAPVGLINDRPNFPNGQPRPLWGGMSGLDDADPVPWLAGLSLAVIAAGYAYTEMKRGRRR